MSIRFSGVLIFIAGLAGLGGCGGATGANTNGAGTNRASPNGAGTRNGEGSSLAPTVPTGDGTGDEALVASAGESQSAAAPTATTTPDPQAVPPCREASWTAAPPVDLRSAAPVRVRDRRLPNVAARASFTTDGQRLVYLLPEGNSYESIDLRRLRRRPVELLGDPTESGETIFAFRGQTSEVGRLSFASGVRSHITPVSVRLGDDHGVVRRVQAGAAPHRVAWDLLTARIGGRLMVVDPAAQTLRPALPEDVPIAEPPTNVAASNHVAFVGADGRPRIVDLARQPPQCTTVAARSPPPASAANESFAASRSGRYFLYAVAMRVTPERQAPGFEFILVDVEQASAHVFATVTGTEDFMIASGGEDRFVLAVHWADRGRTGLYDVDAASQHVRRIGRERPGFTHTLLVSPDGQHVLFQTGMRLIRAVPARPPRPPPPPNPDPPNLDVDTQPLGCDVYGCAGCGWMPDGCGGHQYCGDCPDTRQQNPLRPSAHEGLYVARMPP